MTTPLALATPVSAPPQQPEVVSLVRSSRDALAAGNGGDTTNGRWRNGFSYLPEDNKEPLVVGVGCGPFDLLSGANANPALPHVVYWMPVAVTTVIRCTTTDFQVIDWQGRAQRALDLATPKAVEREFWSGDLGGPLGNLHLTMPADTGGGGFSRQQGPVDLTPTGGPATPKRAFAILEQALADHGAGARGMIHCRPEATPDFLGVRREGNLLLSHNDTVVVPGSGYPNLGPGGAAPAADATWLFATGLTDVRVDTEIQYYPDPRADVDWYRQAMDRATNTITIIAARLAIASWDGLVHYAVQATLPA